jgi:hypothetical protein
LSFPWQPPGRLVWTRRGMSARCCRFSMTQAPHVSRDRQNLIFRELRASQRRQDVAILLGSRHALDYRFSDSGVAPVTPQPLVSGQRRPENRAFSVPMASGARSTAYLAAVDPFPERDHLMRRPLRQVPTVTKINRGLFRPAPHPASPSAAASASFSMATPTRKTSVRSLTGFSPFQFGEKLTSPISPVRGPALSNQCRFP